MTKSKDIKPKDPKSEKKKIIALVVLSVITGAVVAFNLGLFDSFTKSRFSQDNKPTFKASAPSEVNSNRLPPGSTFIASENPDIPSKVVTTVPAAPRVVTAKKLKDVVTEYVDASQDKAQAIRGINFTSQLPGVNKEYDVQIKKTEIAKLKFEEAEWDRKLAKLNAEDVDGYIPSNEEDYISSIDSYSQTIENELQTEDSDEKFEGPKKTEFSLKGVTSGQNGLIAYLFVNDREFTVKDRSVIYGKYTVRIKDIDDVSICEDDQCISVY